MTYQEIKTRFTQSKKIDLSEWCYPDNGKPIVVELWHDYQNKLHLQVDTKLMRYRAANDEGAYGDWLNLEK